MSSGREAYIRFKAKVLKGLLGWREFLRPIRESVEAVVGERPIYVFGSAVEGGLTAASDLDVAVLLEEVPSSGVGRGRIVDAIWRELERRGVPWWYPLEIHLMTMEEKMLLERGGARFIEIRLLTAQQPNA